MTHMTTREATLEDLLVRVARLRAAPAKVEELFGPQTLLAAEQRQGSTFTVTPPLKQSTGS